MKRVFPALVLSLMMIAPLAACTARPSGSGANNNTAGTNGGSVTDNAAGSRSRMGTSNNGSGSGGSGSMGSGSGGSGSSGSSGSGNSGGSGSALSNGRYFADDSGDVRDGHHTTIGDDMRDMTGDMMDGVRRAGDSVGNAINDMTHN